MNLFIYLIHPDHFSKKTLSNISKEKRLLFIVMHPVFKKNLEILGFKNVIEINHNEKQNLKSENKYSNLCS